MLTPCQPLGQAWKPPQGVGKPPRCGGMSGKEFFRPRSHAPRCVPHPRRWGTRLPSQSPGLEFAVWEGPPFALEFQAVDKSLTSPNLHFLFCNTHVIVLVHPVPLCRSSEKVHVKP